ncbi:helix-turn-helix domain-containing protein [Pseudoalteromonas sp. SR41-1]|uniref:AlbA family DNA-binding domain-containing protein n=1 Tax=Pseudoalteromonas sp. SR41-1 TaxID=2760952 RepID=UPI0015FEB90B|nr:ATP-binding protein [Pseudoalteromonas sp. SR41-1]MBB1281540.1 ATP-binding protein [Pseudoalteromonas sp. SR41-1]
MKIRKFPQAKLLYAIRGYMHEIVSNLISKKCEGLWWDFKQKFHNDLYDLLHDIICLSNVIHEGERYLIFGISDELDVIGLKSEDKTYTQAGILDFLRQQPFAENKAPNINLKFIKYQNKDIAILTIENERVKPYFLTKEIKLRGRFLRAGTVYSRVKDTNTPKDSCANPRDIEAMWRERFDLDLSASKRFSFILEDTENWNYNGNNGAFYTLDPDFTIEIGDTECEGGQYWWQNCFFEKPIKYNYMLKFKNTIMHEVPVVHFKNENLCIPFPDIEFVTHPEKLDGLNASFYCDLFYFQKGTLQYSLLLHLRKIETDTPSFSTPIISQIKPPIIELPFYIVNGEQELKDLEISFLNIYKEFVQKQDEIVKGSLYQGGVDDRWQLERVFAEWAFEMLSKSRL